jgi:hypothetical protein
MPIPDQGELLTLVERERKINSDKECSVITDMPETIKIPAVSQCAGKNVRLYCC